MLSAFRPCFRKLSQMTFVCETSAGRVSLCCHSWYQYYIHWYLLCSAHICFYKYKSELSGCDLYPCDRAKKFLKCFKCAVASANCSNGAIKIFSNKAQNPLIANEVLRLESSSKWVNFHTMPSMFSKIMVHAWRKCAGFNKKKHILLVH